MKGAFFAEVEMKSYIQAMKFMPEKVLTQPRTHLEWMQQVAAFSESITTHVFEVGGSYDDQNSVDNLMNGFGKSIDTAISNIYPKMLNLFFYRRLPQW